MDIPQHRFSLQIPARRSAYSFPSTPVTPPQQSLSGTNGASVGHPVPEDLDSAMRYTPLTSVVPASGVLNALPPFHFACLLPSSLTINNDEARRTDEYFSILDGTPQNPVEEALQRETFVNTVNLLNQIDDNQFRFKSPPRFDQFTPSSQHRAVRSPPELGLFASAVLNRTTSNFRCIPTTSTPHSSNGIDPTPSTPSVTASPSLERRPPSNEPQTPFSIPIPIYDANMRPLSSTSLPPQSPKRQSFAVEIIQHTTPTPSSSVASTNHKSKKATIATHLHERRISTSPHPTHIPAEKDRVDAIVSQFTTLLDDIFEAEDVFNHEAEEQTEGSAAFFSTDSLRDGHPWLSKEMHRKLDVHLRKLVRTVAWKHGVAGSGLRIETGDLARITGICERAVRAAEMVELKELGGDDDPEREWMMNRLGRIENAILAANVIMLLITGSGTDQQIYSEETLKTIVEVIRIFLDSLFHWIAAGSSDNALSDTLSVAISCTKQISALLQNCVTLLSQFETQLAETVSQESIINVLQFLAVEAIFLENQARDKESVISNQSIESLRVVSMGILRQVFASYPEQRTFILDEILTSLAKLPANRQQARHFKLLDGKSIQFVSALMMRLVQACGACFNVRGLDAAPIQFIEEQDTELAYRARKVNTYIDEWKAASKAANQSATYIVGYLTSRALQTNKTAPSDSPFKALLDIFTEDFLAVLTAPEWPASELLLRSLIKNLYACIDGDSHGALVKNVALDALGQIAAKIRAVRKKLRMQLSAKSDDDTDTMNLITRVADYSTGMSATMQELENLQQAYRIVWAKADSGMRDALRYQVCSWATYVISTDAIEDDEFAERRSGPLLEELASISRSGTAEFDSLSLPSDLEVSLAHITLLVRSPLFQSWENMLSRILRSMSEKQPTFRTKALRALGQIIVADPDILSMQNVQQQVELRVSDPSPQVREAAIELVSKHVASDPILGKEYYTMIRGRISDAGVGVRKRVIKLLKDIHFKSDDREIQAHIEESILSRITDEEHSVRDLAVKTMEELWFMPPGEEIDVGGTFDFIRLNIKVQNRIRSRTRAMIRVLGENDERKTMLYKRLVKTMCTETGKGSGKAVQSRLDACKLSVHALYDIALNDASDGKMANFRRCLNVVSLFASSTPSVFSAEQVTSLEPYLKGSSEKDDQDIIFHVFSIYRTLLATAHLTFPTEFLCRVMTTIVSSMTNVSLKHLKEAVPAVCLISRMTNDYVNIIKVLVTCYRQIKNAERTIGTSALNPGNTTLIRCLYLLGLFAQHAQIDQHKEQFNPPLGIPNTGSVISLFANAIAAFTGSVVPEALRKIAISSYGYLCLGNTDYFKSESGDAQQIISSSLRNGSMVLKKTILEIFHDYFATEELKAEAREGSKKEEIDLSDNIGMLTGTSHSLSTDEASFFLTGNYLTDILACSLSDNMPLSITATEVLQCIVHGGLAAPNDMFPTLVALETSPNPRVRSIASKARAQLSTRHEDSVDATYRQSMEKLFDYRKHVVNSPKGYYEHAAEPVSLIASLYKDIKSKKRVRSKFLKNLIGYLDRDSYSREYTAAVDVDFARFIIENLLYLDYGTTEEVLTVIHSIDSILSSTGVSLRQSIERRDTSEPIALLAQRTIVFSLIIGLKQYLKAMYNLTETKCRAFDPRKTMNSKDNKPAVRSRSIGIVEWPDIPYLEKPFKSPMDMEEQLEAFCSLIRCDEISGSQEVNAASDDDGQNTSALDDDSVSNENESVVSQAIGGPSTPVRRVKKRKEGSEMGSAKKKQKLAINTSHSLA